MGKYQVFSVKRNQLEKSIVNAVSLRIIIIIICVFWTIPSLGLFVTSLRIPELIYSSGWWTQFFHPFKAQFTLGNYTEVVVAENMGNAFVNSLLVSIPSTVIPITIATFAAYAFAWLDFPGRKILLFTVVGLLVVPLQMAFIPLLKIYTKLGLAGTYLGIWLAHTGFGLPIATYMLYGSISAIPSDLIEAARVDGADPFSTFIRIVLPISVPAIASFAIFQFLWVWNDLLVALVFLGAGKENILVTTNLSNMVGPKGQSWHVLTSGAFITMLVPILVFLFLQRYFIRGITSGAVKG
jgi:alpha-glucoside transport system permease protein